MANRDDSPPELDVEESGCVPLDLSGASSRSFVSGDPNGSRLRVRYFRGSEGGLLARIWFGPGTEGPPGMAHGGSIAAALDETMGFAAWIAGHAVVAASISIDFARMVPLCAVVRVVADVASADGRKITTRACMTALDGTVHARATGLFIELDSRQLERWGEEAERFRFKEDM